MSNTNPIKGYQAIKIFTCTMAKERNELDEGVNRWLVDMSKKQKTFEVVDTIITQSSDNAFHCFTVTIFYKV